MQSLINIINERLTKYLQYPGDSREILLHKKIWWLISFAGVFTLLLAIIFVYDAQYGSNKDVVDIVFLFAMPISLIAFHFYKRRIEDWAFVTQIFLITITSYKTYLMGGLLLAGAPIFIGLFGPVYALIMPNKRRAVFVSLFYLILMISATIFQPIQPANLSVSLYIFGFVLGITQVFIVLMYFTTQVERLKQKEKQRMKELDKFKTRFYTNITHEFRTPLTIILGMAEQLKENNGDPNEMYKNKDWNDGLSMIKRNGLKLLNLTNQMLDLSKLEANAMPVNLIQNDIAAYLKYLVESFHSLSDTKKVDLAFSAQPEEIIMDFDPDKIQNIISNLMSNAIKFTQKGGAVDIILSTEQTDTNENLIISISDNGNGIEEKNLSKVFDRYFQAEHNKDQLIEGTGLGLALTKELVILLGGRILVDSKLNVGSTFTIQLPITLQSKNKQILFTRDKIHSENLPTTPSITDSGVQLTDGKPQDERLILLVVEDNEDVIRYLQSILISDYDIIVAMNGQEGLDKALDIIPDLVISDVMMPVMDGFEFCEKLKKDKRTSHIPVIILTARADMESKVIGLKTGADAYLEKPFNKNELLVRIQKLIELRKGLQERYKLMTPLQESIETSDDFAFKMEDIFIRDVRTILKAHLGEDDFGIEELCRSLAMSRSQLYRKFSALTDITVHQFMRKIRLQKARELLLTTEFNVTEVALETGFKNASHFSRLFSEEYGIAPSNARNN